MRGARYLPRTDLAHQTLQGAEVEAAAREQLLNQNLSELGLSLDLPKFLVDLLT